MTWVQTHTGRAVDLFDPRPEQIDPVDLAVALSRLARFNGHTRDFYSVAQHCCEVSTSIVVSTAASTVDRRELMLAALLHDAHEAYTGDIVRPVKESLGNKIRDLEYGLDRAIAKRFGVAPDLLSSPIIRDTDRRTLATEKRDLLGVGPREDEWLWAGEPYNQKIHAWPIDVARDTFLADLKILGVSIPAT